VLFDKPRQALMSGQRMKPGQMLVSLQHLYKTTFRNLEAASGKR
jgi:hypothetical protein